MTIWDHFLKALCVLLFIGICILMMLIGFLSMVTAVYAEEPPVTVEEPYIPLEREQPQASSYYLDICEDTYLRDDLPLTYELQADLYGACLEFGIDYNLALAVVEQETNYRNVVGDSGDSEGYMQIQRKWWSGLMAEIGAVDLMEPKDNFRTGCAILRHLMDRYGTVEDALSAYNTGTPGQTRYSREVMEKYYG